MSEHIAKLAENQSGPVLKLLDRQLPPDDLSEGTAHVAAERTLVKVDTKSVVVFRIGKEWLALPTALFQEVVDGCTIRTLPDRRGGTVRGLINVRGELLLCIALDKFLGMDQVEASRGGRLLVFGQGRDRFAVQVTEVFGVHRYHPSDLCLTPVTLRKASSGSYTKGILRWQGKAVACLDEDLLLYALNRGLA